MSSIRTRGLTKDFGDLRATLGERGPAAVSNALAVGGTGGEGMMGGAAPVAAYATAAILPVGHGLSVAVSSVATLARRNVTS
jgi:hypothetical protein